MSNLSLIEEYARKLEQEQMDVADTTHSDPNSAEEGRRQFFENNPHMKRYRHRQAQGKAIKQPDDWVGIEGFRFSPSAFAKGYEDWDIGKQISATIGGGQQLIGEHLGYPSLVEKAEEERRLRKQYEEAFASDKHTDVTAAVDFPGTWGDLTSKDVGHFDESIVPMAAALPVGVALSAATPAALPLAAAKGITALGSAAFGFAPPIAAKMYGDERSQGLSPDEALVETALKTSYEALPETLPFLKMFGPLSKNVLTKIVSVAGAESASEILTEALNIGHEIIRQGRTPTLEEVGQRLSKSAAMGFTMGTGFGTASAVPEAVRAVSNMGGTVPPVASDGMPNLPALPQGPAPEIAPSAPEDPSRRQFIQNMGDIATVAATTPTDLLPNLAQAVPAAVETAAPAVAQQITVDYLNLPMPTDYVFDVNGKTVYAMTPDHIDIEQGETFVQFADDMGGDDLPGGVPNAVDIGPYLDPVESISQRDVDKAVARAIQDTLINEGDEFFLGDVRRYYDEAGNNAGPATPFDIQRIEAQNDPEGIFEEVMGNFPSAYFGPGERFPDQYQFDPDPDSIQSPPGFTRVAVPSPRVQKRPILRDPTELEDSDWDSPFEAQIARDAEKLAEQERIEELARDREVTEAIPRLPVLDRKLSEARDRLKSLEAGNPPPGFEDDYTQEEIEEDIRLEKSNIEALEEESRIKQEEPIDAKSKEVYERKSFYEFPIPEKYADNAGDFIDKPHPVTKKPMFEGDIPLDSPLAEEVIRLYKGTPGKNDGIPIESTRGSPGIDIELGLPRRVITKLINAERERVGEDNFTRPNYKYDAEEIQQHYGLSKEEWDSLTQPEKTMKRRSYSSWLYRKKNGFINGKGFKKFIDPGATKEELKAISKVFQARNILKDYLSIKGLEILVDVDHSKQKSRQSLGEYLHNAENLQLLTRQAHKVKTKLDTAARNKNASLEQIRKSEEAFSRSNPFSRYGGKGEKKWWDEIVDRHEANNGSLEEYFKSLDIDSWLNNLDAQDASFAEEVRESMEPAFRNEDAEFFEKTKKVNGRTYTFKGADHLPDVDLSRIIKKTNLKGRGDEKIDVVFVYVPNTEQNAYDSLADAFVPGLGSVFGRAQKKQGSSGYKIAINLAAFNAHGVANVIEQDAANEGITDEELLQKIGDEFLQEYAIRSILQHEFTHLNHYIWQEKLLKKLGISERPGDKSFLQFSLDSYKTFRKDLVEFFGKHDNGYARIGLLANNSWDHKNQKPTFIKNNEQALDFLDEIMRRGAEPTASNQQKIQTTRAAFSMLSELLAYKSQERAAEGFVKKFIRKIKMLLAKVGINIGKDDLNDFIDDLYSASEIRTDLKGARVAEEGPILSEEAKKEDITREVKAKMEAPKEAPATINPAKFDFTNEILRKNNVSEKVISDISKTLSMEEKELPTFEAVKILEEVFGLAYEPKDLANTLSVLETSDKDEYARLTAMIETSDRLFNLDIEEYEGRVDINTGDAIHDLEKEILDVLGPVDPTEVVPPDFNEDAWVQEAWSEPKGSKKKKNYNEQFNATMDRQAGNAETPGYTSPLNQELDRSDDAAQREYTDSDSVSRPKARERTMLRNLFQHLYSRAAQTVRRHSGASKTTGLIADMILRAPHVKQREKETKAGRDYVQKKSMAMGEFRLEAQRALDELTNRGGVIPRKVNDQLRDYFLNGTMPQNGRVAAAVSQLESAIERIYTWSEKVGTKYTEDFSLRPIDGGKLPRVYDTDKVASPEGRRKLMDLLNGIGIVNDPSNDKYDATDVYNIILNSGGFVSGDFTENARNTGVDGMQTQRELFEKIESEIPREQLGDLLLTDYQAIIPRFVDKAIEKTVYAETFGHKNEHLLELKQKVREEIEAHNRKSDTFIETDYVMKSIDEMMDIIHHRYKVNTIPTRGRKVIQAAMNATTMAGLTLVSLASMPEFFTMTALGSKNPAKFATNVMGAATYSALKGLNGMNKLLTGRVMKGYFDPKTKVGKRAKFLRELGLYDISSLGEAAAQRYVGPSFIKAGVGSTGNSFAIRALYRLYGLGNLEKGRFRARQGRALMNMDTYFEINMLTTMTQMQQMMALKNLEQNIVSDAKALSKAAKGKGMKLDSTIAQIKSNLKGYGLSDSEINELVKWYDAGHRELYDVPGEFKLDLAGPAHRFVQAVITLPSEGSLPKVFRNPAFAPFLLFKSFITTFGNTFVNTVAQRLRFAEGTGVSKKYQQGKQLAGMMGTAAAMYGAVQFAQAVGYLIKYGEDDDPWEEKIGDFNKFMQDFERTGLLGPLGSLIVQTATPNYWSWAGKDPYDDLMDYVVGPVGRQASNVLKTGYAAATGGDVDPEGRLAKAVPLTKSTPLRKALGADPYYTKDKKGGMIRRRTLERREEKKAAKAAEKKQTILDSIPNEASKVLGLSKTYIVRMSKKELDQHIKKKTGIDVDGRKSKIKMLEEMMKKKK